MMKNNEKLQRDDLSIWWSLKIKFDKSTPSVTHCRTAAIRLRDHDDHHDDAHPEGENSTKRQKTSEQGTYSIGESSLEQAMDQDPNPSSSVPTKEVSQDLWEEISKEIYEARLKKAVDDMPRQSCNSREEHQYHKVMIHKEIKFCDATLKSVLERLKKYNKDVKDGYVNSSSSDQMLNTYDTMKNTLKII
nr:hypothetical protein [Tanacetum cinerariifolium]